MPVFARRHRKFWSALARFSVLYAGLVLLMVALQRRLTYFPERFDMAAAQARALESGLSLWRVGDDGYAGFLAEPTTSVAPRGTVAVFHGNAGNASDRSYYATALVPRGWRVLLAEYPGYGARPGAPGEPALEADGVATVRRLREAYGGPLLVIGESLGAGVAAGVAGVVGTNMVDGLVLITPWDSLTRLAQQRFWWLPVRWLMRDRYDNVAHANTFGGPVAVLVAERDDIVPRRCSDALFDALRVPKRRWLFAGCGHNDWPCAPSEAWWDEVLGFLTHARGAAASRGAWPVPSRATSSGS